MLDCGTGSGALLLAVLANLPQATGVGIDRSLGALAVAAANAARTGMGERAAIHHADWDDAGWSADLAARSTWSSPIRPMSKTRPNSRPSVRDHEPAGALFAGPDGLDAYRVLVPQLPALLAAGGLALVEIGASQADAVSAIARAAGLSATLHRDLAGRPRVLELVDER